MSDQREGDRRGVPRRERDRQEHLITQAVLAAAISWRHAQTSIDEPESAAQRIEAAKRLRDTVDDYERWEMLVDGGRMQRGAAVIDLLCLIVVLVVLLLPSAVIGRGGLRLLLVGCALGSMGALLALSEREERRK